MDFSISVHPHFQCIYRKPFVHLCLKIHLQNISLRWWFSQFYNPIENSMQYATSMLQWINKKRMNILLILNILRIYCYWRFRVFTRDSFSVNTLCTTIRATTNWHLGIWLSLPNCIIGIWGNSITSKLEEEWGKWLSIEIPLHRHIRYHITDMDFEWKDIYFLFILPKWIKWTFPAQIS